MHPRAAEVELALAALAASEKDDAAVVPNLLHTRVLTSLETPRTAERRAAPLLQHAEDPGLSTRDMLAATRNARPRPQPARAFDAAANADDRARVTYTDGAKRSVVTEQLRASVS